MDKKREAEVRGQRLKAIVSMPEWEEVLTVFKNEYDSCLKRLVKADDSAARGGLQSIERILSRIHDNIKYGQQCRLEIWESLKQQIRT